MTILMSLLILIAGIGALILIHIGLVWRRFYRARNNNNNDDDNNNNNNGVVERGSLASSTMSREDIEKLPSFRYKDNIITFRNSKEERMMRNIGNPKECAVCLENLKEGDKCRLLPFCKHSFHADCVDVWLLKSTRCPICRTSAENSNRDLHFDDELGLFQNDEIIVVHESDNINQETVVSIHHRLSEIQEVEDVHQQGVIEITEDSNDSENQGIKLGGD
ncbi:hypothetical protein Leryth_019474 [Lithospermum erythrorhizon]|nr:hypothetical protein Leryth_019474 [Lithospermum erythrorhizon]